MKSVRESSKSLKDSKSKHGLFKLSNNNSDNFKFDRCNNERLTEKTELTEVKCMGYLYISRHGGTTMNVQHQLDDPKTQKEYCSINGPNIYVLTSPDDLTIKSCLNIELALFEIINNQLDKNKNGFKLLKKNKAFSFFVDNDYDLAQWKDAMKPYVVQSKIQLNFVFTQKLGQGSYGQVFLGESKRNSESAKVAIKVLIKSKINESITGVKNLINEIKVHWALDKCANMLGLLEIYEDSTSIFLVLEYQEKGSLMNSIMGNTDFTENQARMIMEQLLLGIDFFHVKKIIHRDLKLDNILINQVEDENYDVRVADFGLSVFTHNDELLYHKCGTPGYVAPEMLKGNGYSYKSDIFSLGSLFFNLITGRYLFSGDDNHSILMKNMQCKIDHINQYLKNVSTAGRELIFLMLEPDPRKRPTARDCLQHKWFAKDQIVLNELLMANQFMCSEKPQSSIDEMNNSFSSFKIGSCYFKQQEEQKKSRLGNKRNTLMVPQLNRGMSNYSESDIHQLVNQSAGSFHKLSYYNVLRESSRSRSSDKSQGLESVDENELNKSIKSHQKQEKNVKSHFYNKSVGRQDLMKREKSSSSDSKNSYEEEQKKQEEEKQQMNAQNNQQHRIQIEQVKEDKDHKIVNNNNRQPSILSLPALTNRNTLFKVYESRAMLREEMKMSNKNIPQLRRVFL